MPQFSQDYRCISPVIINSQISLTKVEADHHKWLWILVTSGSREVTDHTSQWKNQIETEQANWRKSTV